MQQCFNLKSASFGMALDTEFSDKRKYEYDKRGSLDADRLSVLSSSVTWIRATKDTIPTGCSIKRPLIDFFVRF